jgi:hypothetical protein
MKPLNARAFPEKREAVPVNMVTWIDYVWNLGEPVLLKGRTPPNILLFFMTAAAEQDKIGQFFISTQLKVIHHVYLNL